MALNFPDPLAENPWTDPNGQQWIHDGDGWLKSNTPDETGGLTGFKNKIINGDFSQWQRGTSFSSVPTNKLTADRMMINQVGHTVDISRGDIDAGVDTDSRYKLHLSVVGTDSAAASYAQFSQRIEGVETLQGKQITVSFWARTPSGSYTTAMNFLQIFGSGGSPAASVPEINVNLTPAWTKHRITFSLANIAGSSIGTSSYLWLRWWLSAGSDYGLNVPLQTMDLQVTDLQVEEGPVATSFESRPSGLELLLCQRYYHQDSSLLYLYETKQNSITRTNHYKLPVTMYRIPTITTTNIENLSSLSVAADINSVRYYSTVAAPDVNGVSYLDGARTFNAEIVGS